MNRSKDLRDLFRQSLINERKRPKTDYNHLPYYNDFYRNRYGGGVLGNVHRIPGQYADNAVRIYFYEWSDPSKAPRTFYHLDAFDNFLKTSGIHMEFYQKEIIKNLGTVYITCYTGTKSLNIRSTYKNLLDALHEHDAKRLVPKIQQPKLVFEPKGRWPENDGTFFG
jgi:hypothetical protein